MRFRGVKRNLSSLMISNLRLAESAPDRVQWHAHKRVHLFDRFGFVGGRSFELRLHIDGQKVLRFLRQSEILRARVSGEKAFFDKRGRGRFATADGMLDRLDRVDRHRLRVDAAVFLEDAHLLRRQRLRHDDCHAATIVRDEG